jgi:hypothetical protein
MKIHLVLTGLAVLGALASAIPANAANTVTNGKDGKTLLIQEDGSVNQSTITYSQVTNKIAWTGKALLRDSCEYLKSSKVVPINYFAQPGPTDPVYTLQVTIAKKTGQPCTKVAKVATYWGNYGPVYFTPQQMSKFENIFRLNNVYPDAPSNWYDTVDLSKLKWNLRGPEQVFKNGVVYSYDGRLLRQGEKANCTGIRNGYAGPWCKEVIASSPKPQVKPLRIQSADRLAANFGPITNLGQLQFITGATRNNGFNGGQTIYNGKLLTREQQECTSTVNYYLIDPKTYKPQLLRTEESNLPAMCE